LEFFPTPTLTPRWSRAWERSSIGWSHDWERFSIEWRRTCLEIIATAEDKQRAESVSFTTESTADEHFTEFDDVNKGPVFNADHITVSVFEFVRPEYDVELTVFDTDSDSLDGLPMFDTEPVHDAASTSDYAAFTVLKFACSMKCLHLAVNTDLVGRHCCDNAGEKFIMGSLQVSSEMEEVGSLYPLCAIQCLLLRRWRPLVAQGVVP
jgi:hypothetical protein